MEENYIIVTGIPQAETVAILTDFANDYKDTDAVKNIRLYKKSNEAQSFLILFTVQPDFNIFSFLTNYINYPARYKVLNPFIRGYFKTRSILSGNDFGGGVKRAHQPEKPFELLTYSLDDYEHLTDISPIPKGFSKAPNAHKKAWWKFW